MNEININSNISLHYIPMQKLKTTSIGVYIHRVLSEADASKNALLPYVLKRGCGKCKNLEEISKYLENLYGASFGAGVLKRGDNQIIYLNFETISDKYATGGERLSEDLANLMLSVLFEPAAFEESVVSQEKNNAIDRITAEINDKAQYAMKRCTEEMCRGTAYALSQFGTENGIKAIDTRSLREYYESIITSSVIDIYVCGDADFMAIAEKIKAYTEKISFEPSTLVKTEIFTGNGEIKRVTDKLDVAQGKLCMGFRTGIEPDSDDYIKLMVMNSVFGGGAHSKLFNNVREKLSLCYYASSRLAQTKGLMFVGAGIEFENFNKAYDEILAQLEAIQNAEISELEFNSSVKVILNSLESNYDNQTTMQLFALMQKIAGTNRTIEEMKKAVERVTVQDVAEVAKKVELDTVYFLAGKEEK